MAPSSHSPPSSITPPPSNPIPISTSGPTRFSDPFSRSPGKAGSYTYSRSPTSPAGISARKGSIGAGTGYIKSPPLIPPLPENAVTDGRDSGEGSRRASAGDAAVIDGEEEDRIPLSKRDRRLSREWDASQTVPSRFQKVEGSIWATPASRDGHVARNRDKLKGYKEKIKELTGGKEK